jgi:hypothetical protein
MVALAGLALATFGAGGGAGERHPPGGQRGAARKGAKPPVLRSAASGPWSAPSTWEAGKVPGPGARVLIRAGHRVLYDVQSDRAIRGIAIAGTLRFATDRDTRLDVGLIKIQPCERYSEEGFDCEAHLRPPDPTRSRPALEVGRPGRPIPAGHTARIRLVYFPDMARESCPAVVCCGGRMDFHGAPLSRTWVKLGTTARAGDTALGLEETVRGWRAGDRVIVTATRRGDRPRGSFTEERFVKSVAARRVVLDRPLTYDHLGQGAYRGEVANLSRNVVVESADPAGVRGHTMYHRHSAGAIRYAEFRHLGKQGVLGRYGLHFHLAGDTLRGSSVVGASVWDSANRWLTIHGTNYLVVRDCVGYRSIGHGFFLEDGTEVYNVLDHNLAVGARPGKPLPGQALPFDQNEGAGFWWANSLNTFTRNVAAENGQYGFRFEATPTSQLRLVLRVQRPDGGYRKVDVRTLPFVRFEGNEAHSSVGLYGVNLGEGVAGVGPDRRHPFIIRGLKVWDVHYAFRPQVPCLWAEGVRIHRAAYGVYHPNYDRHVYRDVLISQTDTEPFNRGHDDLSVQYGPLTVEGLTFDGCRSGAMPLIQITEDNPTGAAAAHFRNVRTVHWTDTSKAKALVNRGGGPRPAPKTPRGVPVYLHGWYGPGRHALVVSTQSPEYKKAPAQFRPEPPLTGDESRVAEVRDVPFPKLLDPTDDLPPTTVITQVTRPAPGRVLVRGTTADNGTVRRVVVNGQEARAVGANFSEWEVALDRVPAGVLRLRAHAEDRAGNVERHAHVVTAE